VEHEAINLVTFVVPAIIALVSVAQIVKRKIEERGFPISGAAAKALVFALSCIISTIPALVSMFEAGGVSWNTVGLWAIWVLGTWVPAMAAHGKIKQSFGDNGW